MCNYMSNKFLIFLILTLAITSCSLETEPIVITNINNAPPLKFLKEVKKDGVTTNTYIYQDSLLQSSTSIGSTNVVTDYLYINDTIFSVQILDGAIFSSRKYYNLSETQGVRERRNELGELVDIRTYTFNGSLCGYQNFVTMDAQGDQTNAVNFSFNNDFCDGNVRRFDANGDLVDFDTFLKDGKPAANSSTLLPFFQVSTRHNIISSVKVVNEIIDSSNSYSSVFDYDIDEYPQEEIRTYLDGKVEEYLFIYE